MAGATGTKTSPNGRAGARRGRVVQRVASLREQAQTDPVGARDEAWSWIQELGRRAARYRDQALDELGQLFRAGEPADDISGQTEGLLVTWTVHPVADKVIGTVTSAWMPWVGKAFTPEDGVGVNTLTRSSRLPAKLVWPLYRMRDAPDGYSAFDFNTYVERGRLDPVDVLVIDYASVPRNPALVIRQIRDELVRIVPGANLGKMLVNVPGRSEPFPALYFALKSEIGS